MTTAELARRLEAEGANPATYDIGRRSYDGVFLLHEGGRWVVLYSERGRDQAPMFASADESAACEYYLAHVLAQPQYHAVGFFRSEEAAQALRARLEQQGLVVQTGKLLYATNDYRHQVWVMGKDIFAARRLLGSNLPLQDGEETKFTIWERLRRWLA
jgi:hypothetical protein